MENKQVVYILRSEEIDFSAPEPDDLIGIYSTKEKAYAAIKEHNLVHFTLDTEEVQ
jgi:hypothetical protein